MTHNNLVCDQNFRFSGAKEDDSLSVTIKDSIDKEFGSYTWPCAVVLAQFLWHNQQFFHGKSFLEIGCGTALPSVVALKCLNPKAVILTDKICASRESLAANGITNYFDHFVEDTQDESCDISIHLLPLAWGKVSTKLIFLQSRFQPEIILGSDCFYDPVLFEDVLSTVYFLLRSHSEAAENDAKAKFYCTYQTRSADWTIVDLLHKWGLQCVHIPLELFGADNPYIAMSGFPGDHLIQMMEITLL